MRSTCAQFFPFRPIGASPLHITCDDILTAFKDASKHGGAAAGKKYAVMDPRTGETYPPKRILRLIIDKRRSSARKKLEFFGGKGLNGANQVFRAFGFPVGKRANLVREWQKSKRRAVRISRTDELLRRLFSQKWSLLPTMKELRDIAHGDHPGVYVLAYSDEKFQGKPIREKDVFYVGMTGEGRLSARLRQFRQGIAQGGAHSGADRFFRIWLKRKRYNANGATRFYFAYVSVKCEPAKPWRTPEDLRDLGKVAELEYAAIARVKGKIGHEPLLNKK